MIFYRNNLFVPCSRLFLSTRFLGSWHGGRYDPLYPSNTAIWLVRVWYKLGKHPRTNKFDLEFTWCKLLGLFFINLRLACMCVLENSDTTMMVSFQPNIAAILNLSKCLVTLKYWISDDLVWEMFCVQFSRCQMKRCLQQNLWKFH